MTEAAKLDWPSREVVAREIRRAMLDNPTDESFNKRAEKREIIANEVADVIIARFEALRSSSDPDAVRALEDIERIIYKYVGSEADKNFIDRRWLTGVSEAASEIAALRSSPAVTVSEDDLETIKGKIARAIYDVANRWIEGNFPEGHEFLDFSQVDERTCNLHFDYAEAVLAVIPNPAVSTNPRLADNDAGEITVSLDGKELRGWSYASDDERRAKMLAAREYVEGWCDGRQS